MKKVFKQLHNLVAKNQLKQRFGEEEKVEHFVFITKQKESDVRFHGCYQDEELPKMLFAVADENPEFLEAMKQATKEVEAKKVFPVGGIFDNSERHSGIISEIRRQSEERDREMVMRKKPCPVLPSGIVYHETSPSDIIDVNNKFRKYFFFHNKEKNQAFYLTNENERKFAIDDKRKVYWHWL